MTSGHETCSAKNRHLRISAQSQLSLEKIYIYFEHHILHISVYWRSDSELLGEWFVKDRLLVFLPFEEM